MIAPPRSRCRSAVPEAIPARRVGTELVSECEAGVPASPTPAPRNAKASPTTQYELPCFHSSSMVTKLSRQNRYPPSSAKPDRPGAGSQQRNRPPGARLRAALLPQQQHGDEAEQAEQVPAEQREARPAGVGEPGRQRGERHHAKGRQIG